MLEPALILKEQVYIVFTMNFFWIHVLRGDTLCHICIISCRQIKQELLPNFPLEESKWSLGTLAMHGKTADANKQTKKEKEKELNIV